MSCSQSLLPKSRRLTPNNPFSIIRYGIKEREARKKIHEEHGRCDDLDFADSKEYIDNRIGEYDEPQQKGAEITPVYEAPSKEKQERKSPSKSERERDGWER